MLGRDPYSTPRELADRIVDFWERTTSALREDALAVADEKDLVPLAEWLNHATQDVAGLACGDWAAFRRDLPRPSAREPYRRGYELARAVRKRLQPGMLRYDFAKTGPEVVPWVNAQPPTAGIQGLVAAESPACAVPHRRETARRFLLARGLGDYLGRTTHGPAILSGLATDRQAQSRAFAAEFLAPSEALRKELPSDRIPLDAVDDLALEFDVSSHVVRQQIENHDLAQIADW